jgi:hypothetical protein
MRRSIPTRAPVFPLAPDFIAVDRRAQHLRGDVGDCGEDPFPVPTDLLAAGEATLRMCRRLVPIVRRKAGHHPVYVVSIGRALEARQRGDGATGRMVVRH